MKDPLSDKSAHEKVEALLKVMRTAQERIADVREILAEALEADKGKPKGPDTSGCSCVHDEVFSLDCLLFAIHQTMHLYGSGIVTHLGTIDVHEKGAQMQTVALDPALEKKLKDGTATVAEIVTALPNTIEDDGPGPDGAH